MVGLTILNWKQGTVLKKLCAQEEHCYKQFNLANEDPIKDYVPAYQGIITLEDDESKKYY